MPAKVRNEHRPTNLNNTANKEGPFFNVFFLATSAFHRRSYAANTTRGSFLGFNSLRSSGDNCVIRPFRRMGIIPKKLIGVRYVNTCGQNSQ